MGREFVIEARGLVRRFADVVAVKGVDILVEEGEIYGLLGPNGAGKTTTIRMICGLIRPTRGTVRVFGYRMPEERIKASRLIGYVTQHTSLYEDLTVYENLMFYASVYGLRGSEKRRAVEEALDRFLLREFKDKMVGKLSGGTAKRVSLAVSMVHNPKLLILDEPTAGVDPKLRRVFWDMFRDLSREGLTLLVTTHYMDEAEALCDRIAIIDHGNIIALGTPDELKSRVSGDVVYLEIREGNRAKIERFLSAVRDALNAEVKFVEKGTLMLTLNNAPQAIPKIFELANEITLGISELKYVRPSLNDVFIKHSVVFCIKKLKFKTQIAAIYIK